MMRCSDIPSYLIELAEQPVTSELLHKQANAFPHAWDIAQNLLRSIELDDLSTGLVQESIAYGKLQAGPEHAAWLSGRQRGAANAGRVQVTRNGNVIDILLARPEARNAIDRTMRDTLHEAFTIAAIDVEVTEVRLRGAGKAFCVGADLDEFGTTRDPATAHAIRMQTLPALALIGCADKFDVHVQGACVGAGLELAAFARRLTATSDAWFQLPELAMGLVPGAGGCVSVTRRIGRTRAALMILSGKRISARTALGWGLIDAIMDNSTPSDGHPNVDS